jgi:hypothetical protein
MSGLRTATRFEQGARRFTRFCRGTCPRDRGMQPSMASNGQPNLDSVRWQVIDRPGRSFRGWEGFLPLVSPSAEGKNDAAPFGRLP